MNPAVVLDTGALIALDRNSRSAWALLRVAADAGAVVHVPAGVIAQAWRDGSRPALLSRALRHCDEVPLDGSIARAAGLLCGRTGTSDVIDATVALAATAFDRAGEVTVVTTDPNDIRRLTEALGVDVRLQPPRFVTRSPRSRGE